MFEAITKRLFTDAIAAEIIDTYTNDRYIHNKLFLEDFNNALSIEDIPIVAQNTNFGTSD